MIKAVVFDIGATLVTGPPVAPHKEIARIIGADPKAVKEIIMKKPIHFPSALRTALDAEFGHLSIAEAMQIDALWYSQEEAPKVIDGAHEVVHAIATKGYKMCVLSDIWCPYFAGVSSAFTDFICYFPHSYQILSFMTGHTKPDPYNFERVLSLPKWSYLKPEEVVMVGDTYSHDILPAIELGWKTVWVLHRPERENDYITNVISGLIPRPTKAIPHISALTPALLEQL